jgi:hypothetical protein
MPDTAVAGRTPLRAKRKLTRADHALIQQKCHIDSARGEDYAAVFMVGKGFGQWSIHVFARQATQREIDQYEQTASKLKFKGQKASMEGSQTLAAVNMYNALIARAYDVLVGLTSVDQMSREEAAQRVPPLVKREAIKQWIGEVYGETRLADAEGDDDDDGGDDDNPEAHTSREPEDSEP